jgi:hypothetical protein
VIAVLNWSLNHWYVFLWLSVFGVFEGVRDFFAGIAERVMELGDRRHERRMEMARARSAALPAPDAAPKPGPCVHRRVRQVRDLDGDLAAWLCDGCDTQLPADWAVAKEDL